MAKVLNIELDHHDTIKVMVFSEGEVVIKEKATTIVFTPEEWEKISVFVLEEYKKLNEKENN